MKIQAIALQRQPDFLRLLLVKMLSCYPGGQDGAALYPVSLALRKLLLSSRIHPVSDLKLIFEVAFLKCLEEVINRSGALITRVMELTKATCRTS